MDYGIFLEGIETIDELERVKPRIVTSAYQAINAAAARGRTMSANLIRDQINFPASYLTGKNSRLAVTQKASSANLEAVITGRRRATSLARFVTSGKVGKAGVSVNVKSGKSTNMPRAFLMRLRSGTSSIDTASNLGLAIRVPRGTRPSRAYKPVRVDEGLYLLYGPSVDQVFKTVREDVTPDVSAFLETEFLRLLDLRR